MACDWTQLLQRGRVRHGSSFSDRIYWMPAGMMCRIGGAGGAGGVGGREHGLCYWV